MIIRLEFVVRFTLPRLSLAITETVKFPGRNLLTDILNELALVQEFTPGPSLVALITSTCCPVPFVILKPTYEILFTVVSVIVTFNKIFPPK